MTRFSFVGLAVILSLSGILLVSCSDQNSPTGSTNNPVLSATPTPFPPSPTSTFTITSTATETSTATSTGSFTPTFTLTLTGTPTPPPPPTLTFTPTITSTPTVTSTPASQLFVSVLHVTGTGTTIVGIQGPYSNGSSSNFSFALPAVGGSDFYLIFGLLDLSNSFAVPSSPQSITLPSGDYAQYAPTGSVCLAAPGAAYTSTTTGIGFTMSSANGTCTIPPGTIDYYNQASGTAVTLSGAISQSGL